MLFDIHIVALPELEGTLDVPSTMHTSIPERVTMLCDAKVVVHQYASLLEVLSAFHQLLSSCCWVIKLKRLLHAVHSGGRYDRVSGVQKLHWTVLGGLLCGSTIAKQHPGELLVPVHTSKDMRCALGCYLAQSPLH
jgi:hypothetical protein